MSALIVYALMLSMRLDLFCANHSYEGARPLSISEKSHNVRDFENVIIKQASCMNLEASRSTNIMADFRVIIVGGGIGMSSHLLHLLLWTNRLTGGLTLANCLQHAKINFVLLEGRKNIGSDIGSGVGIDVPAARILDQLGIYSDLENLPEGTRPRRRIHMRDHTGRTFAEIHGPELLLTRLVHSL